MVVVYPLINVFVDCVSSNVINVVRNDQSGDYLDDSESNIVKQF